MFDNQESSVYKAALADADGFQVSKKTKEIKALVERKPEKKL